MNNIDRLFSDTLQNHSSQVPAGMWERVEPGLPVASSRWTWMRWAAVVVPAVVAVGIWMNRPEDQAPVIADKSPVSVPSPTTDAPVSQATVAAATPRQPRTKVTKQEPLVAYEVPVTQTEPGVVNEVPVPAEIAIEPVALETETVAAIPETPKPIVLVYTLEAVAAPDDVVRKESSLERVVEFARKHSDPISEVRGLKDELFALDFRKKQTKKN